MTNQTLIGKKYFYLDDEQKLNWLRLIRSQNVGPVTFRQLISHFGTAQKAIEALPELARRGGAAAKIKVCPMEDAEREMLQCERHGARFVTLGEPDFPCLLRNCEESPPLICVMGPVETLTQKMVAIVGSRNASISGTRLTEKFASELGEAGYVVVSGLARGIDTAAHKASLNTGTIAVFAGGIDYVYPPENRELVSKILENNGALISEMPIGWNPRAKDFPRRNRIVTGLANGIVVVEAARRSGSLISARLANEMGRVVMAVPGSPGDPRSEGTNALIRNGSTLVTSTEEILEAIKPLDQDQAEFHYDIHENEKDYLSSGAIDTEAASDELRKSVVQSLNSSPTHIDDIIRFCGATPGQIQLVMMELELAGRIERHTGNRVSLLH